MLRAAWLHQPPPGGDALAGDHGASASRAPSDRGPAAPSGGPTGTADAAPAHSAVISAPAANARPNRFFIVSPAHACRHRQFALPERNNATADRTIFLRVDCWQRSVELMAKGHAHLRLHLAGAMHRHRDRADRLRMMMPRAIHSTNTASEGRWLARAQIADASAPGTINTRTRHAPCSIALVADVSPRLPGRQFWMRPRCCRPRPGGEGPPARASLHAENLGQDLRQTHRIGRVARSCD